MSTNAASEVEYFPSLPMPHRATWQSGFFQMSRLAFALDMTSHEPRQPVDHIRLTE